MTDEELWRLCHRATDGPWEAIEQEEGPFTEFGVFMSTVGENGAVPIPVARGMDESDAAFVAASREAVPDLLHRVAELERRLREEEEWKARFATDSEAYRQGVEDGRREMANRVIEAQHVMEPTAVTALEYLSKHLGLFGKGEE